MEENTLKRIKQYIDYKGISVSALEKEVGMSNGSFASQLKNNKTIGVDKLENILKKYPEINLEWLLTGNGEMLKNMQPTGSVNNKRHQKPDKADKELPLIPINAMAGLGGGEFTVMEGDILRYYKVPEFSHADFLIPVSGSSMQPKYYGGDLLACKLITSLSYFQWGVPHVISIKDRGTVVKRVKKGKNEGELLLISDNERYEPYTITLSDIINIALVVGVIRLE